jgi:protein-S-isoprenylcysteine O-methyltransferase Ste14
MTGLHWYFPSIRLLEAPYRYVGAIVIVLSIGLMLWAARLFNRADAGIIPFTPATSLVVVGPYRFTRNPMYLGMAGTLLGVALLFGTLAPLMVIPVFVALVEWRFIRAEEAMLAATFGDAYTQYKSRVRRWV